MNDQQNDYVIQIDGHLDSNWTEWLNNLQVIPGTEDRRLTTTLRGTIPDQAALRGLLNRLWDLNLSIISVNRITR